MDSRWICETDSEFKLILRKKLCIHSDFGKKIVNSKWNREKESEFKEDSEFIENSRNR